MDFSIYGRERELPMAGLGLIFIVIIGGFGMVGFGANGQRLGIL